MVAITAEPIVINEVCLGEKDIAIVGKKCLSPLGTKPNLQHRLIVSVSGS